MTVRRALDVLRQRGIIRIQHGGGSIAVGRNHAANLGGTAFRR